MQWGTLVAAPQGDKPVQDFKVGDKVLAAGTSLDFTPLTVQFSDGTREIVNQLNAIHLDYGDQKKMIVTPDHVFYLFDGTIKRADTLTLDDQLVSATDKGPVKINSIENAPVKNGFHHISTSTSMPTSLEGHLINVEGIVSADYAVQLYFNELKAILEEQLVPAPVLGSREYRKQYPGVLVELPTKSISQVISDGPEYDAWPHTMFKGIIEIPKSAASFVTKRQANQIRDFVPKRPFDHTDSLSYTEYLISIYKVFYPNVTFHLDWPNENCNAFAWKRSNKYHVVIQGGLVRAVPLKMQAISLVIADALGYLFGDEPHGDNGYACTGSADYFATWIVMRKVWYGTLYQSLVFPAIDEIEELFSFLSNAGSEPVNGCEQPTLECRITTFMAGVTLSDLPACAGGPETAYLEVVGAESSNNDAVIVSFNEELDKQTAEDPANYIITPRVEVQSATLDPNDGSKVILEAITEPDMEYRLYVEDIISANGESLNPYNRSADFSG